MKVREDEKRRWEEWKRELWWSDREESWLNPSDAISAHISVGGGGGAATILWRLSEGIFPREGKGGVGIRSCMFEERTTLKWIIHDVWMTLHQRLSASSGLSAWIENTSPSVCLPNLSLAEAFHENLIFYISISVWNLWIKAAWQPSRPCDVMPADRWRLSHSNTALLRESLGKDIHAR